MRRLFLRTFAAIAFSLLLTVESKAQEWVSLPVFTKTLFYDGYLVNNIPDTIPADSILRHTTSCYAIKLTDRVLNNIGDSLRLNVWVKACCDNYDRIGNVNLALVPKGAETYNVDSVQRIELGRFITPFMDKNKQPDTVPYTYSVNYLSYILRDAYLRSHYDLWMEFEIFGVPYAANEEIEGCAGRSDVFQGTLALETNTPALSETDADVLVPIVMKKPEYIAGNLNNYSAAGTDTIGKCTKTYTFTVPKNVADAQLVVVTSNHGSNQYGEEYNRRWHYIYVDDSLMLTYKPGRTSCEPFRKYNTCPNGIYGKKKHGDTFWQSFSNWCPGDVIDNRIIALGPVTAGQHKVRISVPEAKFEGGQGDIPVSIFFQGLTQGDLMAIDEAPEIKPEVNMQLQQGHLSLGNKEAIANVEVYDLQGKCLYRSTNANDIDMSVYPKGILLVNVEMADGIIETHKIFNKK